MTIVYLTVVEYHTHPHPHHDHGLHSHLHSGSSVSADLPQRGLRLLRMNWCMEIVVWWSTQCVRVLDILKLQLFVLYTTDTISFPLFRPRFGSTGVWVDILDSVVVGIHLDPSSDRWRTLSCVVPPHILGETFTTGVLTQNMDLLVWYSFSLKFFSLVKINDDRK